MWTKIKALPVLPKMLIVFFILVLAYGALHRKPAYHNREVNWNATPNDSDSGEYERAARRARPSESNARSQMLANYQAQQAQLMARAQNCEQQMNEATRQQAMAAMNGQMYNVRPACEAAMPQMIAQEAFLETEIYKLQGGDPNATVRDVSGIAPPQYGGSPYFVGFTVLRIEHRSCRHVGSTGDSGKLALYRRDGRRTRTGNAELLLPRSCKRRADRERFADASLQRPRL